jgi:hypothetical protein
LPLPLQCSKLMGPGFRLRHLPSMLSPPSPCWFHLWSMALCRRRA